MQPDCQGPIPPSGRPPSARKLHWRPKDHTPIIHSNAHEIHPVHKQTCSPIEAAASRAAVCAGTGRYLPHVRRPPRRTASAGSHASAKRSQATSHPHTSMPNPVKVDVGTSAGRPAPADKARLPRGQLPALSRHADCHLPTGQHDELHNLLQQHDAHLLDSLRTTNRRKAFPVTGQPGAPSLRPTQPSTNSPQAARSTAPTACPANASASRRVPICKRYTSCTLHALCYVQSPCPQPFWPLVGHSRLTSTLPPLRALRHVIQAVAQHNIAGLSHYQVCSSCKPHITQRLLSLAWQNTQRCGRAHTLSTG